MPQEETLGDDKGRVVTITSVGDVNSGRRALTQASAVVVRGPYRWKLSNGNWTCQYWLCRLANGIQAHFCKSEIN